VLVHLFEWKWTDIARECENYLGPKGFAAVQVSPPNEHALIRQSNGNFPWWERYQPVSYRIDKSRSGTGAEFRDMVLRCHNAGVDIYVDAVINHMTGGRGENFEGGFFHGSSGSPYTKYSYPGTYSENDFHTCHSNISNYGDVGNVQSCELVSLADLDTGSDYVRATIATYLIGLAQLGVRGFRVDAVKHISPTDMAAIADKVDAAVEPDPYYYQEVIDNGGEAAGASDYFGISNGQGDVTEFKYQDKLSKKFLNASYPGGRETIAELRTFGESWGLMPSDKAIVFTNNHDTQRGHAGGAAFISYQHGRLEDLASVFMLAWPYGYPSIMSSYAFDSTNAAGTDAGPPSDESGNTIGVYPPDSDTPNCFDQTPGKGWVCEHRWRPIGNMVAFRNYTNEAWHVDNWWDNGANQIAFSRGDRGFVAINREDGALSRTFQTGLPAGMYCDVINGDFDSAAGTCSGPTVTVDTAGSAAISVGGMSSVAIYGGARLATP
jgi:alpha-amylase